MRFWIGVTAALGTGALAGFLAGIAATDEKYKKEYQEATASMRRALELAKTIDGEALGPVDTEEELEEIEVQTIPLDAHPDSLSGTVAVVEGTGEVQVGGIKGKPNIPENNPYHTAVSSIETPHELFIDGGINDYGISYIEEEEYEDSTDGRQKLHIEYIPGDTGALFFMEGEQLDDWSDHLGESFIIDFFRFVPPNAPQVLYVRNHKLDIDYEVVAGTP